MEVDGFLHVAETAVRRRKVRILLQRVSKDKLKHNLEVCADDGVAENAQQRNALASNVLAWWVDVVTEFLVYFLQLIMRHCFHRGLATLLN
jgi:hypothetical protein